jgi:hypothetical protein
MRSAAARRPFRRLVLPALLLVLAAAAAPGSAAPARAPAQATDLVVKVAGTRVSLAGVGGREPLGDFVARFGAPTVRRRVEQVACDVRWSPIGLRVLFANLGGLDPCSDEGGHAQRAVVTGARWRTARGLRIGDSLARLRERYPGAVLRNRVWWLARAFSPIGTGGDYPVLAAVVRSGEVRALRLSIGAAGD